MSPREQLTAYLATLATLIVIFLGSLAFGAISDAVLGKIEMFGLGTITGGLIGVLRIPSARNVTIDNAPNNPVPVEDKQ